MNLYLKIISEKLTFMSANIYDNQMSKNAIKNQAYFFAVSSAILTIT